MDSIKKIVFLAIAAIGQGLTMSIFLFPHFIPSGGAAGLSVIMNVLFQIPFGITIWVLNASLLCVAFKYLGKINVILTLYCVTWTSVTIQLLTPYVNSPLSHVLLDLILGSILFGICLGIIFRLGASSGGMDILALIISKWKGTQPGITLFWINGSILLFAGIVVEWRIILFALVCQFIATKMIDWVGQIHILVVHKSKEF